MRRILLTSLLLLLPGQALAGPPEGVSGRMAFDEVVDGLRRCHAEKDAEKRLQWLTRLAPKRDPRIAVALCDAIEEELNSIDSASFHREAAIGQLLLAYYIGEKPYRGFWRTLQAAKKVQS